MPTYSKYSPVGGGGGGITSINGDTTAAQLIVGGTGISVATALGTTTITNTSPAPATGNLTETISSILTITGGTGAVVGSGTTIQVLQAGAAQDGFLSSTDWNTFNNKQNTLSFGNLTETVSSVLTITGGTGAVIGSGTTIQMSQAGAGSDGYLSSTDWNTFNNKQPAGTYVTSVTGSAPIASSGGTTPAISITQSGVATDGYLSSTDWNTFNNKATYPAFSDDQVLYSTTTGAEWRIVGTGSTTAAYPTDTVIVGRTKPAGLTGVGNFIIGDGALNSLTTQTNNIAIGKNAASLVANTGLVGNTIAIGFEALKNATASYQDASASSFGSICIGYQAGSNITLSYGNLYVGYQAGRGAGRHDANVAVGHLSGNAGAGNTCVGTGAGLSSTNFSMTAIGFSALRAANALSNSALGSQAGRAITSGSHNTLIGTDTCFYTGAGGINLTTGNSNTLLGTESATLANNSVGAISLGRRAAAASKEFAVGSDAYDIETVLLGRGGASQTVANAVKIQTMRASGTDTSMTVGTLTLAGAQGTGTGAGGDVIIATAPAGASGSSLNSHVDRLKVTASGETQLLGSTSGYVGLSSPAAPTSYSLVLPSAQGAASSVLTNDGSGNLSWTAASSPSLQTYFGDGSDGSLTVTTSSTTSGPLVSGALTRDAYFDNLTISGSGQIFTNGWRIYVRGTLDITNAGTFAINYTGFNGVDALTNTGGSAPVAQGNAGFVAGNYQGKAGTNGTTGAGSAGVSGTGPIAGNSGGAGLGGPGGSGAAGSGGSAGTAPPSPGRAIIRKQTDLLLAISSIGPLALAGGAVGGSGASGAGNGSSGAGGGGGGSGNSGGVVYIAANEIDRGASTAAGAINARGGSGGDGGNIAGSNCGGGGGGGGSGGGYVYLYYASLAGSTATNAIIVSGGDGGDGGNGVGTGTGGTGGSGGGGGCILILDLSTGSATSVEGTAGSVGTGPSGTLGGSGGAGATTQANL
jgi:hypothetical protein